MLLEMLSKGPEPDVKNPVVQNIFNFITTQDQVDLAQQWLKSGFIHTPKEPTKSLNELLPNDKRMILKTLCRSTKISTDTKKELMEKVLKDDKSDIARRTRLTCEAASATLENKEKYWKILIDENTEYSIYDREAMISGFCSWDQLELCEPFSEKFYDALTTLSDKHA